MIDESAISNRDIAGTYASSVYCSRRGSGIRTTGMTKENYLSRIKYLNVITALKNRLYDANKDREAKILASAEQKVRVEYFRHGDLLVKPSEEAGINQIEGRLPKELRSLVNAVESVINDKPNEFARAYFRI